MAMKNQELKMGGRKTSSGQSSCRRPARWEDAQTD